MSGRAVSGTLTVALPAGGTESDGVASHEIELAGIGAVKVTASSVGDVDGPPLRLVLDGEPIPVPRQVVAATLQSCLPAQPGLYHQVIDGPGLDRSVLADLWHSRPSDLIESLVRHALVDPEWLPGIASIDHPPPAIVGIPPSDVDHDAIVVMVDELKDARTNHLSATGLQPPEIRLEVDPVAAPEALALRLGHHRLAPLPPRIIPEHLSTLWRSVYRAAVGTSTIERWWASWSSLSPITAGHVDDVIERSRLLGLLDAAARREVPLVDGHRVIETLLRHHEESDDELGARLLRTISDRAVASLATGGPATVHAWEADDRLIDGLLATATEEHAALSDRLSKHMAGGPWVTITEPEHVAALKALLRLSDTRHAVLSAAQIPSSARLEIDGRLPWSTGGWRRPTS